MQSKNSCKKTCNLVVTARLRLYAETVVWWRHGDEWASKTA